LTVFPFVLSIISLIFSFFLHFRDEPVVADDPDPAVA